MYCGPFQDLLDQSQMLVYILSKLSNCQTVIVLENMPWYAYERQYNICYASSDNIMRK